jgi:hypothetical protein
LEENIRGTFSTHNIMEQSKLTKKLLEVADEKPLTRTKGNVIVEHIKVGDVLYEFGYGCCIKTKVISLPKYDKTGRAWTWKAESLYDGREIKYLVDPKYPHYSSNLYTNEAYSGMTMI